jgi:pentatricopeptide repeat protein
MYDETYDPRIEPTTSSYNAVMHAWSRCPDDDAPQKAELLLEEMLQAFRDGYVNLKPDIVTFTALIDLYSKRISPEHVKRAEELFGMMEELGITRNAYIYAALQNVYARSGRNDAPLKAENLLHQMLQKGERSSQPNIVNYNAVLIALSRTPSVENTKKAEQFLEKMILPHAEGGYDVETDRMSYIITIYVGSRCPDESVGARLAEKVLAKMEEQALHEWQKKQETSSVAPLAVYLDVECYNPTLQVISRSHQRNIVSKIHSIVSRMEQLAEQGHDVLPTKRTWNCLLHAYSRSFDKDSSTKAEGILCRMWKSHFEGVPLMRPDSFTYSAVLQSYQKSGQPEAAERADKILRQFEEYHAEGLLMHPPDVVHYTIVAATWAKSRQKGAADRCAQIISHMMQRHDAGFPNVKPNTRTYNALLDAVSRNRDVDKAEEVLYYMITLAKNGDDGVAPDAFSFNSVIVAHCRSNQRGAGPRAEAVLERMIEYHEEGYDVILDTKSFSLIIEHYGRTSSPDGPYRAENMLQRLIDLCEYGDFPQLEPTNAQFIQTIDAYSYKKHPDSGVVAERLLKKARNLISKYKSAKLEIDTELLNAVMMAWSTSGDKQAGRKAEIHLETLERQYAIGNENMKPDIRSYGLVLSAWSRSSVDGKARRALGILRRMQEQRRNGNTSLQITQHAYSLVINTAGFSNGSREEEEDAFAIAVSLFDEMVETGGDLAPNSLTFGWFIQVCGRLTVPVAMKEVQVERAFQLCVETGMVTNFVLNRLRGAASEALYKKMLKPMLDTLPEHISNQSFPRVEGELIPEDWKRSVNTTFTREEIFGGSGSHHKAGSSW